MSQTIVLKPAHKAIKQYYQSLEEYRAHHVKHEGALETAFQRLLDAAARQRGWQLIPKQTLKIGKTHIAPDGTLRDLFNTRCGFWEAKDTDNDLDQEISKKMAKGYPTSNTIFEDTRQAVLFQGGVERGRFDLTDPKQLAALLNEFFTWTEPEIDNFHHAVEEFKTRVPELAGRLVEIIKQAHQKNKKFQTAFNEFFVLCQKTLNPNISQAAVDEMLVQHLLTERLIRKIFDNPDFKRRNVIAAEVEKVIDALVSLHFNRDDFLKSLDRFYRAIEDAAHTLEDFNEKQHFLNTVYERFFQGYSVKVADTHGIVYTPQPIVDFMCASVEEVVKTEFGLTLGSPGVNILDPCTGTGNFIVNLIRRVPKRDLPRVYREQLFANEVMLLPYYIATLNIEHAYYEITEQYEAFEGMCFVDTLDMAKEKHSLYVYLTEANTVRVDRQKKTPITVVIGNPPYNAWQLDENDNNKNRKYPVIEKRVRETYAKDSRATNKNSLWDPYVKFFRWAVDRLQGRDGIVCFVSNNSLVDQVAFDGMRKHLLQDFSRLYHLHLEGNVRHNPKLAGTTYNVFGIQVGVGITVAVRCAKHKDRRLYFTRVDKLLRREEKLAWLAKLGDISQVSWQELIPDSRHTWLRLEHGQEFTSFTPIGDKEAKSANDANPETIFKSYGRGVATCRDEVVYDFHKEPLIRRVKTFIDEYNGEVDRLKRTTSPINVDNFVRYDKIKWSRDLKLDLKRGNYGEYDDGKIRTCLYRPFCKRYLFFDRILNEEVYVFPQILPTTESEVENRVMALTDLGSEKPFMTFMFQGLVDLHVVGGGASAQCFPLYMYDENGTNRRENITDWALDQFRAHYKDKKLGKWDIFYYVYGILHHPGYRTKFADNLKRELPRIPLAPDFCAFAKAGKELARLHLDYEKLEPYPLKFIETEGVPLSYRVEDKMRLDAGKKNLHVNKSLTLAGIPPETFHYRLGNRSALEWVVDQYQVKEDKRSGIRSDPNREDDEEYIVRLVGQVVRVSVETVRIAAGLPEKYAD